jgi:hypothetical protein
VRSDIPVYWRDIKIKYFTAFAPDTEPVTEPCPRFFGAISCRSGEHMHTVGSKRRPYKLRSIQLLRAAAAIAVVFTHAITRTTAATAAPKIDVATSQVIAKKAKKVFCSHRLPGSCGLGARTRKWGLRTRSPMAGQFLIDLARWPALDSPARFREIN